MASDGCEQEPCFWLRGLLPLKWLEVEPAPDEAPMWSFGFQDQGQRLSARGGRVLEVFADASGGELTEVPSFRRVGWGWCVLGAHGGSFRPHLGHFGGVPGSWQTINAGEMMPLLDVLLCTSGGLLFVSDSAYAVNGWNAGRHLRPEGSNARF